MERRFGKGWGWYPGAHWGVEGGSGLVRGGDK